MHMRSTGLAALTLTFGLALGGCEEEETDVSGYVSAWSTKVCDAVVACNCDYPGGSQLDHCLSQLSVGARTQAELLDVEGLTFDGACADQAISDIDRLGCGVFMADPNAECRPPCKVFYGPMHAGGTCTTVNGFDNCNQGLVCDAGVCVHPCDEPDLPQLGEACATQFGCDEGLWCDAIAAPLLPVCASLPALGEPCLPAELGFTCGEGLICDTSVNVDPICVEPPGLDEECPLGACAEDLYCDNSMAPAICIMLPGLGELCPLGLCAAPNLCEGGLCEEPRPEVCGFYGGVPEGLGEGSGGGTGGVTDPTGMTVGEVTGGETATSGAEETGIFTTGIPTGGSSMDCCVPHETPACDDIEVATCVCEFQPECCVEPWGESCVELVTLGECGGC